MPNSSLAEAALDAMGNPIRRAILRLLAESPRPVQAIADELPVSRPAVSKHLRLLEHAELVTFEKRGTSNIFRLESAGFDAARSWLDGFWDDALSRFAMIAENTESETS